MTDVWHIAVFELRRAIRTWRAAALLSLFAVSSAGATYLFVRMVGLMENALADQLMVPRTRVPGTMLRELTESDTWREVVSGMVGAEQVTDFVLSIPPLALFDLWFLFLLVPFFAAAAAAESISIDVQSRAIRYETLRTGRPELVLGRFIGQLLLTWFATLMSAGIVFGVGIGFMVIEDRGSLLAWLLWFSLRASAFAVPFVGLGIAASQITSSPAWARVMAITATAGSWVAFGVAVLLQRSERWAVLGDVLLQVLPQGWMQGMWGAGLAWLPAGGVQMGLGLALVALGYLRFARRDL